jgi:hypothetical protein
MADSTQIEAGTPNFQDKVPASYDALSRYEVTVDVTAYAVGGFPRVDAPPATPDATSSFEKFVESLPSVAREVQVLDVQLTGAEAFVARWDRARDTVILLVAATGVEVADGVDCGELRLGIITR